jgi:WD40 repeat protein
MSPDGTTVVTAGADESLRFWRIYEESKSIKSGRRNVATKGSSYNTILGSPTASKILKLR